MKTMLHMWHMRYLVYRHAITKALRESHVEMVDYLKAFREMLERTNP